MKSTETKTFWTVVYREWGWDTTAVEVFDNAEEAKKFASQDYHDNPVRHTVRSPKTIAKFEEAIKRQNEKDY